MINKVLRKVTGDISKESCKSESDILSEIDNDGFILFLPTKKIQVSHNLTLLYSLVLNDYVDRLMLKK
jgi:hypothetical protein